MRTPASMKRLEELGRVRLSPNFFMREMLCSSEYPGFPEPRLDRQSLRPRMSSEVEPAPSSERL